MADPLELMDLKFVSHINFSDKLEQYSHIYIELNIFLSTD